MMKHPIRRCAGTVTDYYRENYNWEQNLKGVLEQYGISH